MQKRYLLAGLVLMAGVALAAASSDRLKDTVIIGQGTSSTKTVTFDLGNGSSNPKISATSANALVVGEGEGGTPLATKVRGPAAAGANVAGADLTFDASNGTGTGGSGKFIFRIGPVAAPSSTANSLFSILTLKNDGTMVVGDGDGTAAPLSSLISGPSGAGANIAGPNTLISAGNGTGTGGSGKIIFETSPTAASSSTANTYATRLTLDNAGDAIFGAGDQTSTPFNANIYASSGAGANIAGADMNIYAGDGTGSGGSGKIIFRIAAVAASSSTANTYTPVLTLKNDGTMVAGKGDGTASPANGFLAAPAAGSASNTAGVNLFLDGGNSTGNAAGGSVIIRTAPAGGSGSSANSLTTAVTVNSTGGVSIAGSGGNTPHNCAIETSSCGSATSCPYTCSGGKHQFGGGCNTVPIALTASYPASTVTWTCGTNTSSSFTIAVNCCDY